MKRLIFLLAAISLTVPVLKAQETKKLKHNPTVFIGQWEAKVGEITYLLTIEKTIHFIGEPFNVYVEMLVGGMVTKKGDVVIRDAKVDGSENSILAAGNLGPPKTSHFIYKDKEKKKAGEVTFKLDEKDPTKAHWTLLEGVFSDRVLRRYNEENFDYPLKMTFKKVK